MGRILKIEESNNNKAKGNESQINNKNFRQNDFKNKNQGPVNI